MNTKQHALAAEVRAEMAVQQIKPAAMQRQVGVSSSAWHNYFVKCSRDVPMSVVVAVAEALGMAGSELLRRAESRIVATDPSTVELEAGLSQSGRRALEKGRAEAGDWRDPSRAARVDVDDGSMARSAIA